jgi:hypothetical protein
MSFAHSVSDLVPRPPWTSKEKQSRLIRKESGEFVMANFHWNFQRLRGKKMANLFVIFVRADKRSASVLSRGRVEGEAPQGGNPQRSRSDRMRFDYLEYI